MSLNDNNKTCELSKEDSINDYIATRSELLKKIKHGLSGTFATSDQDVLNVIENVMRSSKKLLSFSSNERKKMRRELFNRIRRLDVLSDLLEDDSITEIMVNGTDEIFIERAGKITGSGEHFDSRQRIFDIAGQIASGVNRSINIMSPILDARLSDGSRANIVLDPIAINGPIITIRRFPSKPVDANTLISVGSLNEEVLDFIKKIVKAKYNILISGANRIIGLSQMTFRKQRVQTT